MSEEKQITQSKLKEILDYDRETGVFRWKSRRGNGIRVGCVAGRTNKGHGYITIECRGKAYLAHRLAWMYEHGCFPSDQIDHINQDKKDNSILNLRPVSQEENSKNLPIYCNNSSGHTGVTWCKRLKKWKVQIRAVGENMYLGIFEVKEEAIKARMDANIKYGFHKNHGKISE